MQLALEIARLETLPLTELRRLWKHYFKTDCEIQKKGLLHFKNCLSYARTGIRRFESIN